LSAAAYRRWFAYGQVALSLAFVGVSVPLAKMMMAELPIMLACGVRFVAAVAVSLPLLVWSGASLTSITHRDHYLLFAQALPGVFLFPILLFEGLKTADASAAGVVTGTLPAAIAVVATLLLRERPVMRVWAGVALAVLGMVVLNTRAAAPSGQAQTFGLVLVFTAVIAEAVYSVLARALGDRVSPFAIAAWLSLFGLIAFAPFALYQAATMDLARVSLTAWAIAVYLGVFPSVASFLFYYSAIRHIEAARAGVFTSLLPLTAMATSVIVLKEHLGPPELIGAALTLVAIALTATAAPAKETPP